MSGSPYMHVQGGRLLAGLLLAGFLHLAAADIPISIGEGGLIADPIIVPFDGSDKFFFDGMPGSHYNLFSDDSGLYEITFKTKLGVMYNHNGTYMQGLGLRYADAAVVVEVTDDSFMKLSINGKDVPFLIEANFSESIPMETGGHLQVAYTPFVADIGDLMTLDTDDFLLEIQLIPAGIKDKGGVPQPSYLNVRRCRLKCSPPGGYLQGVLGETYPSGVGPHASLLVSPDGKVQTLKQKHPLHPDEFYEVAGYPQPRAAPSTTSTQRRRMLSLLSHASERRLSHALEASMTHSL